MNNLVRINLTSIHGDVEALFYEYIFWDDCIVFLLCDLSVMSVCVAVILYWDCRVPVCTTNVPLVLIKKP